MSPRRRPLALIALIASLAALASASADPGTARAPAPFSSGLALSGPEGAPIDLARFGGRVVIVNFWASWCLPCRYEMPLLQKLRDRFNSRGLEVLAVAVDDDLEAVKAYLAGHAFTFPVAFDGAGASKRVFGVASVPETYVVGRDGRLLAFTDPRTGETGVLIDDPTVWEGTAIVAFLERALGP